VHQIKLLDFIHTFSKFNTGMWNEDKHTGTIAHRTIPSEKKVHCGIEQGGKLSTAYQKVFNIHIWTFSFRI
jgi:hypothetical protein